MGFLISSGSVVVSVTRHSFGRFANPWGQNIPPNRNCLAGRGLRDDQNEWFSRLQWLNGGSLGEMGKSLRSSHHRADIHFSAGA